MESVRLGKNTKIIEASGCSFVSVWCVRCGEMAISSLAPKVDAEAASGVGMEPLLHGWGPAVSTLTYTAPWKVLRQGRAVAAGTAEIQHKHSWNDLGICLPDHQDMVQGQGDNKTTLLCAIF